MFRFTISIRDILTWVDFINACSNRIGLENAFLHGASLTFLDSLGSGATSIETKESIIKFRNDCKNFLLKQTGDNAFESFENQVSIECTEKEFGIKPFYIDLSKKTLDDINFSFIAPTTAYNTIRLLRGLQLNKAILLEGSPGVGKTSLVIALAKCTGNEIFRINLSDQTVTQPKLFLNHLIAIHFRTYPIYSVLIYRLKGDAAANFRGKTDHFFNH